MRDEEIKLEEIEVSHTLVDWGETPVRGERKGCKFSVVITTLTLTKIFIFRI